MMGFVQSGGSGVVKHKRTSKFIAVSGTKNSADGFFCVVKPRKTWSTRGARDGVSLRGLKGTSYSLCDVRVRHAQLTKVDKCQRPTAGLFVVYQLRAPRSNASNNADLKFNLRRGGIGFPISTQRWKSNLHHTKHSWKALSGKTGKFNTIDRSRIRSVIVADPKKSCVFIT